MEQSATEVAASLSFASPVANSTTIMTNSDEDETIMYSDGDSFVRDEVPEAEESVGLEGSFDLSHRNVADPEPILEEPVVDDVPLDDTVLEEQPEAYTVVENGSQKGTHVLVSSSGYAFGVKRKNKNSVIWRCNVRNRKVYCQATVVQRGDTFVTSPHSHIHAHVPDRELKAQVYSKVRSEARSNVFRPAMDIVEDVILDCADNDNVSFPKRNHLKRIANRNRAKLRPQEQKDLNFEIDHEFLQTDEFLIADVRVDAQRHFLFGTEQQFCLMSRKSCEDYREVLCTDSWNQVGPHIG